MVQRRTDPFTKSKKIKYRPISVANLEGKVTRNGNPNEMANGAVLQDVHEHEKQIDYYDLKDLTDPSTST